MRLIPALRRPSYAEVAATLALVTSLSGSAYAAVMVTSADIKNDTIASRDVRNSALRGVDVEDESLTLADLADASETQLRGRQGEPGEDGAPGANGTDGEDGAPGADGATGPVKVQLYTAGNINAPSGFGAFALAECPVGRYLVESNGRAVNAATGEAVALSRIETNDRNSDGYLDMLAVEAAVQSFDVNVTAKAWCAPFPTP